MINAQKMYLWRPVDAEGEVLEILVQKRRDKRAPLKLMRKLLKKQGYWPRNSVTDKLRSYSAAVQELGIENKHATGGHPTIGWRTAINLFDDANGGCSGSSQPVLPSVSSPIHSAVYNTFNTDRHLISPQDTPAFPARSLDNAGRSPVPELTAVTQRRDPG